MAASREIGSGGLVARKNAASQPGTAVSVGAVDTPVAGALVAGSGERYLINDHATNVIYVRLAATGAALNTGIRLNAAGGSVLLRTYTGPISAIATGAGTPLLVTEV